MRSPIPATLVLLLAGCLAPGGPPASAPPPAAYVDPFIEEHDHSDPAEHNLSTPTLRKLFHTALNGEADEALGIYGELDLWQDRGVLAITGIAGETPGFVTFDLADPTRPRVLAFAPSPGTGRLADVKIHPSGGWILAAAQSGTQPRAPRPGEAADAGMWSSQNGLRLYRVDDWAAPVLVQTLPSMTGYGCHMAYWRGIAGTDWLFCVGRAIEVYSFDAAAMRLTPRALYAPQGEEGVANLLANDARGNPQVLVTETRLAVTPHDMTIQDDPLTGAPVMVVSWWDLGIRVVDVSDPTAPRELGAWAGDGARTFEGNVHTAMLAAIGDRRVAVGTPELLSDNPSAVWLVDFTDYARPTFLAEWVAPGEHGADGIRFSTHNIQVVGERLYMAHYHAGVWVLDLAAIAQGRPAADAILGYHLPTSSTAPFTPPESTTVPNVWDVVVKDGYVYASDSPTGLHVLHYVGDAAGDPRVRGFA